MKQLVSLFSILIKSAKKGLTIQRTDGSFPPGHNGPWNDVETPLRTTAHWSILMKFAFENSEDEQFLQAHRKAIHFLLQPFHRPRNVTFVCRTSNQSRKNQCNGLVGQAWVLEALLAAHPMAFWEQALELCSSVFGKIPYSEKEHGWNCIETNGQSFGVHRTVNQQAWFSVMALKASQALDEKLLENQAIDFFSYLLTEHPMHKPFPGLFCHETDFGNSESWKEIPKLWKNRIFKTDFRPSQLIKSQGYLSFILYALAMGRNCVPNHPQWDTEKSKKSIQNALIALEQIGNHRPVSNEKRRWFLENDSHPHRRQTDDLRRKPPCSVGVLILNGLSPINQCRLNP